MYDEEKPVNTYNPEDLKKEPKKMKTWQKGLIVFGVIFLCIILLGTGCSRMMSFVPETNTEADYIYGEPYIGVLELNGVIGEEGAGSLYNQQWFIDRIDQMMDDSSNEGMIVSMETPGGDVYSTDEIYLKIQEYKETTGRPVYTYMRSMAASGGYYVAAATDKIYANRNTWTGSIGVTVGTFVDASEFLDKMGIKTVTITAGANKAMGSATEPMTEEQQAIVQGLVDDAYEQFTGVVSEGRGLDIETVKTLADGRVYTASQALDNGLIDEIGTIDDAIGDMQKKYELGDCIAPVITYCPDTGLLALLKGETETEQPRSEIDMIMALMDKNNQFSVNYLANITK